MDLIPGSGRSPAEGNSDPLWCSCLQNPMDRGAWRVTAPAVAESDVTGLAKHARTEQTPGPPGWPSLLPWDA